MKKQTRQIVFNKYKGRCAYCGEELQKGWHVDELLPIRRVWRYKSDENGKRMFDKNYELIKEHYLLHPERLNIDNQMPSCPSCNINKHSMSLEEFRKSIKHFIVSLNRDSTQYKIAKRYGLIKESDNSVVFYFEINQHHKNLKQ